MLPIIDLLDYIQTNREKLLNFDFDSVRLQLKVLSILFPCEGVVNLLCILFVVLMANERVN